MKKIKLIITLLLTTQLSIAQSNKYIEAGIGTIYNKNTKNWNGFQVKSLQTNGRVVSFKVGKYNSKRKIYLGFNHTRYNSYYETFLPYSVVKEGLTGALERKDTFKNTIHNAYSLGYERKVLSKQRFTLFASAEFVMEYDISRPIAHSYFEYVYVDPDLLQLARVDVERGYGDRSVWANKFRWGWPKYRVGISAAYKLNDKLSLNANLTREQVVVPNSGNGIIYAIFSQRYGTTSFYEKDKFARYNACVGITYKFLKKSK
jgi:hypothetical protein